MPPYSTGTPVPSLSVHGDSAPTVYQDGNPKQTDTVTRMVERAAGHIQALNPITHDTDHVTSSLAGTAARRNLHMLTSDPRRNPTFTLFAHPDYYLCAAGFQCPFTGSQVVQNPGFAWNHGDIAPEINTTWLGLVGPGWAYGRERGCVVQPHRPASDDPGLLGLKDDYRHQGRVLAEVLDRGALPRGIDDVEAYVRLRCTSS